MADSCVPRHIVDKQIKRIATLLKNAVVVEIDKAKKGGTILDPGEVVASVRSNILNMPGREWLAPLIDEAIVVAWPDGNMGENYVSYS